MRRTQELSVLIAALSHNIRPRLQKCRGVAISNSSGAFSARPRYPPGNPKQDLMPSPRLLIIEGNSPQSLTEHIAVGGTPAHQGYSNLMRELMPGSIVDTCHPGDPGATLLDGESLAGYDGIAITGSSLHIYQGGPSVTRQVELVRAALATGTPLFGSCWGLQV